MSDISVDIAKAKSDLDVIDNNYDDIKYVVINDNDSIQNIYRRIDINEYFVQLDVTIKKHYETYSYFC